MAIKTDTFTGGGGGGGGGAVTSVNTQTGAVVLSGNDLVADHTAVNYTAANANVDGHFSGIDTKLGTIASGLTYKGAFNATAGTPSIANALQGDLYIIDTAGTIYGQTWAIGDHLLINADMGGSITNSKIDKIDNTEPTNVLITTNNLSDLDNATTARTNLGLGNVATLDTGVANGNVIIADATGLPVIDGSQLTGITATDSTKLAIANNLSDLNNATTARTNLGLGNVATLTTGVSNGNVIVADATGLPAIDGSQLTGITSTDSTKLAILNNLSDLNNATTARTNLGLGNVATLTTGVANGNVIVADATGLPAIDGSQLTGITSTDSTKLAILNNLSDLNNAGTARTNLGLGNVATLTTGVANGNVIVADATGLPAIDGSQLTGITSTDSTKLAILNNLSDLNNATTARTNLGLGNVATLTTGVANGNVIVADATGLPAIDGSQLTGITSTDSTKLAIANNLSDLNNAVTARTNLGLGNVATLTTGVSNGNVIVADVTGLPAIDGSQLTGVTSTDSTKLAIANNLSDLNNAVTARTNLGLGNVATLTTGVSNGNVIVADATGLPAIDGSQLTGITSTDSTKLAIANNLSDLNNAVTARTNLGLGNVATLTTGVANGNVIIADATGLPAIDGSQLTGVTATDSTKLAILNNLSDLNNATTARTNLGLGNVATLTTGVSNGNVIVADATGLPAIDGSQLTGVTSTDSSKLAIANNLSDLNNATTARTNLGLGNVATLTTGVANGNVIVADATGLPAIDGSQLTNLPGGGGGSVPTITTVSQGTDYTISTVSGIEEVFLITPTANININLPAAATATTGYKYQIKNIGSFTLTLKGNGSETIDDVVPATGVLIASQYEALTIISDGSNWWIV